MENRNLRILAIDDNQDNLIMLKALAAAAFPEAMVLVAPNGQEGIALARAADPDVILLDVVMPGMDGYAVCRVLKDDDTLNSIPVVFLTAMRSDRDSRIRALEAGAEGFLTKPLDQIELTAQIRAMAKIKAANAQGRHEKERLTALAAERTRELERELAERVQAEEQRAAALEALRASEERFRGLYENATIGLYRISPDGQILMANPAAVRLLGFRSFDELAQRNLEREGYEPSYPREQFRKQIEETGTVTGLEAAWVRKDGTSIHVRESARAIRDEHGRVLYYDGVFEDITERKRAEAALQESEVKAHRLLEQQIAINQLALALGESLDLDEVYHTLHKHIQSLVDVWCFIISSYDEQAQMIRAEYAESDRIYDVSGFPPIPLGEPGKGTQSRVIHTGQPLYTPDHQQAVRESKVRYTIEENGSVHEELSSEKDKANTTRAVVYLPMKIRGKAVGVMQVQSRRLDAYSAADIDLLAGMANVAAVAIQDARLHEDVLHELGERKRTEEQLRRSEANLQTAQQVANVGSCVWNIQSNRLEWSAQMCRIFGLDESIFTGDLADVVARAIHPADRAAVEQSNLSIINGRKPVPLEYRVIRPDGTVRVVWAEAGDLTLDAAGQPAMLTGIVQDITERKRADEALRLAEHRYRHLFAEAPIMYVITRNQAGVPIIEDCNASFLDVLGYSLAEVAGRPLSDLYTPRSSSSLERGGYQRALDGRFKDEERELVTRNGQILTALLRAVPETDSAGQVTGTRAMFVDISERKQAESTREAALAALRESEERYRSLVENITDMIYTLDLAGRFTFVSPVVERFSQYRVSDLLGHAFTDFIHPDDLPGLIGSFSRTLHGEIVPFEYRILDRDRTVRHVRTSSRLIYDGDTVVGIAGVMTDITERKRTEAALIAERSLLRTLVDNLPDSVYVKDTAGRKTLANPANVQHLGVASEADVLGKTDDDLFPPDLAAAYHADDQRVLRTDQPVLNREELVIRPDGSRGWQSTSKVPLHDSTGEVIGLVGIGHDITERKLAEDRLRQTLADLQRSNADLERFAYVASHDLQEPLRMVASYVQLLGVRYQGQLDADADEFIGYAMDGARRMQQLILDLLEYSRVGTRGAPLQPTDTGVACGAAIRNLETALAEAGATVTCDPLPTVPADTLQLTQVFQNLIGNAIKFCGAEPLRVHIDAQLIPGGSMSDGVGDPASEGVRDGADESQGPLPLSTSPALPLVPSWLFSVRDNGIGIDPQYFDRIFVIFQRLHTRDAYPGTGIGLAICKRIIEHHGGRIWVESTPGQGATFCFTLPA